MKHHLNIIIIALRVIFAAIAINAIYNFISSVIFIQTDDPAVITEYFSNTFTPLIPRDVTISKWFASAFTLLYGILLIYGITAVIRFYKCLLKIEKGNMFYEEQGTQLRKTGATIIIFAKLQYLLFCTMGGMFYFDLTQFFKQLPEFLALYLIGKLILLYSYMAEKGEFIREENDLTV